ncbi:hypothetical protein C2R22_13465 [Salinigranum rubrum]|uniref:Glycosyltransferase family 1 protein n=1 Tax=Salinigranum rubrum TaxID=755307 RepID=A0A2I8VKR1_9EURY|nr:glycosyltransferase family 4 protein [Salinigranum rubrum]AUV82523.1 hypothetical protein C2R22_13465 [Salinigranum rubrum]
MKIAYLLSRTTGGLPQYTAELANHVESESTDVHVFKPVTTSADEIFSDEVTQRDVFRPDGLSHVALNEKGLQPIKNFRSVVSYRNISLIDDFNPDIIHVTDNLLPHVAFYLKWYSMDEKYPIVVTHHAVRSGGLMSRGDDLSEDESLMSATAVTLEKVLNTALPRPRVERYIVHTESSKEILQTRSGVPTSRIPHGAYEIFSSYDAQCYEERNTVLLFGRLVPSKGFDTLIRAAPLLAETDLPDLRIVIAGSGEISEELLELIKEYEQIFEVYNYYIPDEEVAELFSRATVVAIPQKVQAGHSGTLTIAFSFGKPVVATNIGEFPELVEESGSGRIVPPEDPERLAEAIHEVLSNEDRNEMKQSSKRMSEKLSWSNVAKEHMNMYESHV